jgi:hypothetical protein
MQYDYYNDIKNIVIDIRNELTLDESINRLNSFIEWLLEENKNEILKLFNKG